MGKLFIKFSTHAKCQTCLTNSTQKLPTQALDLNRKFVDERRWTQFIVWEIRLFFRSLRKEIFFSLINRVENCCNLNRIKRKSILTKFLILLPLPGFEVKFLLQTYLLEIEIKLTISKYCDQQFMEFNFKASRYHFTFPLRFPTIPRSSATISYANLHTINSSGYQFSMPSESLKIFICRSRCSMNT